LIPRNRRQNGGSQLTTDETTDLSYRVGNLLQTSIQELETYKEKFQSAYRELQLLRADPNRMSNLTLSQLEELRAYMQKNLKDVENVSNPLLCI
jgi:hypothetical protein